MPDVKIRLVGDSSRAVQAFKQTTDAAKQHASASQVLGDTLLAVNQGMELAGRVADALKQAYDATVGSALELGEATEELQNITGATAEEASTLNGVMQIVGLSQDKVATIMEAAIRKGYAPTIDGLKQMKAEYNSIQDPIARTKYLMDTFGRSGADLTEFMKLSNAELDRYTEHIQLAGLVIGQEGIEKTEVYGRQLTMLNQTFEGLKATVGMSVIPTMTNALDVTNRSIEAEQKHGLVLLDFIPIFAQVREAQRLTTAQTEIDTEKINDNAAARYEGMGKMYAQIEAQKSVGKGMTDLQPIYTDLTKATMDYSSKLQDSTTWTYNLSEATMTNGKLAMQAWLDELEKVNPAMADWIALQNGMLTSTQQATKAMQDQQYWMTKYRLSQYDTGGGTPGEPNAPGGRNRGGEGDVTGGNAIGGRLGMGWSLVGEAGPELVYSKGGGQPVINNYDYRTSYNVNAHYPTYQDPHGVRNDLIGLTLLRNAGAAKWAA